jgi:mRNA interferase YafQ
MLQIHFSRQFKKDYKKILRNKKALRCLQEVISILAQNKILDKKYYNHFLKGAYQEYQECHVLPDLLLIYKIDNNRLALFLIRVSTHLKIFNK